MPNKELVSVKNLVKEFGKKRALDGISLTLEKGEFLTIFGPNGAGKTTLLRSIAGLVNPSSGEVEILGEKMADDPENIRSSIGLISHNPLLYDDLTAYENLKFYADIYFVKDCEKRLAELLNRVGLAHRKHDFVRSFSRGMLQRLSIARALIHDPTLLLLDEPYTGLDPLAMDMFDELLMALKKEGNHGFIMTSHDLNKGFELSDRLMILSEGRIKYDSLAAKITVAGFKKTYLEKAKN